MPVKIGKYNLYAEKILEHFYFDIILTISWQNQSESRYANKCLYNIPLINGI
jgi:hypothetical protein